jgi:hypothetical protein
MKAFKFFTLTLLAFVSFRGAAGEWIEEFNGKSLDESKWCDWVWSFQGRRAGFLFARDNVAVSNGCLNLTARLMREDEKTVENLRRGFTTYATSLVRSQEKFSYGYFECRAKTMNSKVCNAFWLYDPLSDKPEKKFRIGDYSEEIDIFEIFGSLKDWYGTVHCLKTPYLEGIVYAGVEKLPNKSKKIALDFDPSADFHVYGFLWSEKELVWYIDGKEVFRKNFYFLEFCQRPILDYQLRIGCAYTTKIHTSFDGIGSGSICQEKEIVTKPLPDFNHIITCQSVQRTHPLHFQPIGTICTFGIVYICLPVHLI